MDISIILPACFLTINVLKRSPAGRVFYKTVGGWRLAVGSWRLAVGSWRLAIGDWRLAVGSRQLAVGGWEMLNFSLNRKKSRTWQRNGAKAKPKALRLMLYAFRLPHHAFRFFKFLQKKRITLT
jgi:hypothetical protein